MVFAGLGCPNGCDFCCTSHFFKRRHIKLLPTGRDIYNVAMRYQELEPGMGIVILDEDFLLSRKRAMEFRDCVLEGGVPLSIFAFASMRALSRYSHRRVAGHGLGRLLDRLRRGRVRLRQAGWAAAKGALRGAARQTGSPS